MTDAENLDIKKRARRRLVGAVALALLAAVVLPMIMEQEPHPAVQDIQITIPDRDGAEGVRRAPPAGDASAPAPAVPVPEDEALAASDKPAVAAVEPAAKPEPEAPAVSPPRTPAPPATPPRNEPPAARPAPEPRPAAPAADEEARVRAILSGQVPPPRGESFVIQVGAFSDAAKASRLADDLKAKGFAAYTERAGNVTRVRVGPIPGRAAADSAASRLKAAGHQAVLQPR